MSESDDTVTDVPAADKAATDAPATEAAPSTGIDLATRPDGDWLNEVEGEIDDVDRVLKCLARDSATICTQCHELTSVGSLEQRPVLARCASTKQPR